MATDTMTDGAHMAAMMMDGKPACGGDQQVGEYDVGIHVLGLCEFLTLLQLQCAWVNEYKVLVLAFSIFGMEFLLTIYGHLGLHLNRSWLPSSSQEGQMD